MTLLEHLDALEHQPDLWPVVLEQMRFLEPGPFQATWFVLVMQLTLQARTRPKARREPLRQQLEALWRLADSRLGPVMPSDTEPPPPLPLMLIVWLLGDYYQTWSELDYWEGWLRSYYPPEQVLSQLAMLLPFLPGWRPATRQRLLKLAMRFLEPAPEPEAHLEALGELTAAARELGQVTQAELLLDEMPLLLDQTGEEQPFLAFSLAMQWLAHGQARQARFALKIWRRSFTAMSAADQFWEARKVLNDLSLSFWLTDKALSLEAFSLLHGWLQDIASWVLARAPVSERRGLLLRLIQLGQRWELPETSEWIAALGLDGLEPVPEAIALAYARTLEPGTGLSEAYDLTLGLPPWLRRLSAEAARPLQLAHWSLPEALERQGNRQMLLLRVAGLLLQHSTGRRHAGRRRRILAWGFELIADLQPDSLSALSDELRSSLKQARPLLSSTSASEALQLADALNSAQAYAGQLARLRTLLERAGSELTSWAKAVLALPPDELGLEHIKTLQNLTDSLPPGWERWDLLLTLAQGQLSHLPWDQVRPLWEQLLNDWPSLDRLDSFDQLRGLASLSLSLAEASVPDKNAWFTRLYGLAESLATQWRPSALAAVGHCQIRSGALKEGLLGLRRIDEPAEQLNALLQVGSVLREIKDPALHPELLDELYFAALSQERSDQAWQGYVAIALARWTVQERPQALKLLREGLGLML